MIQSKTNALTDPFQCPDIMKSKGISNQTKSSSELVKKNPRFIGQNLSQNFDFKYFLNLSGKKMGITSSKKKAKKIVVSQKNDTDCQISTIEEVEEHSIPEIEDIEENKISNLTEQIEEISENAPELILEVNALPELTTISKLPNDIPALQSFGNLDQTSKLNDIVSLKSQISALIEERDNLRTTFTEEFKTKLAEIHDHLQKRLDFLQQEVEINVKAKYEASLKSYEVQMKILEKKNKILQDL